MQVVILAAGRGERFSTKGYVLPKPLISVSGKPMIQYAVENVLPITDEPIIICPAHLKFNVWGLAQTVCSPQIIGIKHTQRGAAMSLLAATAVLDEEQPVMVLDCDSIVDHQVLEAFSSFALAHYKQATAYSALLTFKPADRSPRYSFVDYEDDVVYRIVEKQAISDMATCGVHSFASWGGLRAAIATMMAAGDTTNGEFYLAPVHNYSRVNSGTVVLYEIPESSLHSVGTPEQLQAYEEVVRSINPSTGGQSRE